MSSKLVFLENRQEWAIGLLILVILSCVTIGIRFFQFDSYISADKQRLEARVLTQYEKNNKWVLKLKASNGMILYTTSKENLKDIQNRDISIFGKPAKCTFWQSFRSCFFIAFSIDLMPKNWRSPFYEFVQNQHQESLIAKLYQTLFFASSLPKEWRDFSSLLKISHLLAISGLHLGIIALIFYWIVSPIYQLFQKRYFTYRNRLFDIGVLLNLFLLAYLFLLDFPPSFVRAYVMSLLGLLFVYCHFSLINFVFLVLCACLILALFPDFFLSIGFWFSFFGVFYIFLFLKYFSFDWIKNPIFKVVVIVCMLNVVLFFNMLPLTHIFFPSFSLFSILAIPLSIVFAPFFCIILFAHLFGVGWIFDDFLNWVLGMSLESRDFLLPYWVGVVYVLMSILAIKKMIYYDLLLIFGVLLYFYYVFSMFV